MRKRTRWLVLLLGLTCAPACVFDPAGLRHFDAAVNDNNGNNNNSQPGACGDGRLDPGEDCDDGNTQAGDGCDELCHVQDGWVCTGEPSVCVESCGNGELETGETCDDANLYAFDGCSASCQIEHGYYCAGEPSDCHALCGDGLQAAGIEAEGCDDGNTQGGDGCDGSCDVEQGWQCPGEGTPCDPVCGDGLIVGDEECDDGAANSDTAPDACRTSCLLPSCGDGVRDSGEVCDTNDFGGASCTDYPPADAGYLSCLGGCAAIDSAGCYQSCGVHTDCPLGQQCPNGRCESVGNTCDDNPTVISGSGIYNGNTENLAHNFCSASDCGNMGPHTHGGDQFFQVTLAQGQYVTAWLAPTGGWDGTLAVMSSCSGPTTFTCSHAWNRADEADAVERIDFVSQSNGNTIFIVVDGDHTDSPMEGAYDLHVEIGGPTADVSGTGQVVFSELMPLAAGSAQDCEWLELYNATTTALNLQGLDFLGAATFSIDYPLVIRPQGYLLLARYAEPSTNCGLTWVDWVYTVDYLRTAASNTVSMERSATSTVIDTVVYDSATWPYGTGQSSYLCTNHLNAGDNDAGANWQVDSVNAYGTDPNHGTPGAANPTACNPP